jgi:uncharacterized protein (DUF697 family)
MGTLKAISKGAGVLRPFVNAVRGVDRDAADGGAIAVLDGEPAATARLREILGVEADAPLTDGHGLLVHACVPGHDPTLAAAVLAGAKREDRNVLALLVGPPAARDELERTVLANRPLEPSNVAHVASLADERAVLAAVARTLGDQSIAAGRRYPQVREAVADMLVGRAARQAGAVGVAAVVPGSDLPVITLVQVRLVAQLAALHGRPLDMRRGLEIGGVLVGAFGWRAIARRAAAGRNVAGFAVRGGVAYTATRAIGEAARAWFTQAGERADQPLDGLNTAIRGALNRKGGS